MGEHCQFEHEQRKSLTFGEKKRHFEKRKVIWMESTKQIVVFMFFAMSSSPKCSGMEATDNTVYLQTLYILDRFTKRLLWNINGSQVVLMEEYHDKPCRIFFFAQMSLLPLVLALIFGVGLVPFGAIMRPGRSCIIWYW